MATGSKTALNEKVINNPLMGHNVFIAGIRQEIGAVGRQNGHALPAKGF